MQNTTSTQDQPSWNDAAEWLREIKLTVAKWQNEGKNCDRELESYFRESQSLPHQRWSLLKELVTQQNQNEQNLIYRLLSKQLMKADPALVFVSKNHSVYKQARERAGIRTGEGYGSWRLDQLNPCPALKFFQTSILHHAADIGNLVFIQDVILLLSRVEASRVGTNVYEHMLGLTESGDGPIYAALTNGRTSVVREMLRACVDLLPTSSCLLESDMSKPRAGIAILRMLTNCFNEFGLPRGWNWSALLIPAILAPEDNELRFVGEDDIPQDDNDRAELSDEQATAICEATRASNLDGADHLNDGPDDVSRDRYEKTDDIAIFVWEQDKAAVQFDQMKAIMTNNRKSLWEKFAPDYLNGANQRDKTSLFFTAIELGRANYVEYLIKKIDNVVFENRVREVQGSNGERTESEHVLKACERCQLTDGAKIRDLIVRQMVLNINENQCPNRSIKQIERQILECHGKWLQR
jgi:hypothetical protein